MSVLSVLTLQVPPDRSDDVVRYYATAGVLEAAGAQATQLCVDSDDPGNIVVIARWPDAAAYEAWQAAPERAAFSQGIADAAGDKATASSSVLRVVAEC